MRLLLNRKVIKKNFLFLFFLVIFFLNNIFSSITLLSIKHLKQKKDFCGEASVAIMLNQLGYSYSQGFVHRSIFDLKNVERGAYSLEIISKLKNKGYLIEGDYNYGFNSSRGLSHENYKIIVKNIKNFIDKGYPVFFNWYIKDKAENKNKPHFSLLIGYTDKNEFLIYDPRWKDKIFKIKIQKLEKLFLIPTVDKKKWGYCYFIIKGKI